MAGEIEQGNGIEWEWVTDPAGWSSLRPVFPERTPEEAERDRQFLEELEILRTAKQAELEAIIGRGDK